MWFHLITKNPKFGSFVGLGTANHNLKEENIYRVKEIKKMQLYCTSKITKDKDKIKD